MSLEIGLSVLRIVSILLAVPGVLFAKRILSWSMPVSMGMFHPHADGLTVLPVLAAILINSAFLVIYGVAVLIGHWWGLLYATALIGIASLKFSSKSKTWEKQDWFKASKMMFKTRN